MSLKQTLKLAKQLENQSKKDESSNKDSVNLNALKNSVKPRNHLAFNPLLRKGGVHQKDDVDSVRKKKRRETKQSLRQQD